MPAKARTKDEPIENLMGMYQEAESKLRPRIVDEIAALEARLQQLREYKQRLDTQGQGGPASQRGIKIPPKYRNPENPDETWAGRGMHPKWLDKAIKAGKKLDDFKI